MKIGNVEVKNNIALGPMAGVTDLPFRLLCREQGCGLMITEMVSAKAVLYNNKNTVPLMTIDRQEHPVGIQLFGSDPEVLSRIGKKVAEETECDFIDLNMGCPVPKIVNNKEGSALMTKPDLVKKILSGMVESIPKPVTVKMRKGFLAGEEQALEISKIAEECGVAAITIHGRTRDQYYSGEADWDIIKKVKEEVSIPVIGNGDVTDGKSAKEMLDYTGCDGVMVARAARGNPWIFREINHYLKRGEEIGRPSLNEICDMIIRHALALTEFKGEYTAVREMRKHISWYTAGIPNASRIRQKCNNITSLKEMTALLDEMQNTASCPKTRDK